MPIKSYLVSGIVSNSKGDVSVNANITFKIANSKVVTTNSSGQYVFDLSNIDYTSTDIVTYAATDKFNNEVYTGSFTLTGENKTLNISLSSRTSNLVPPGNRDVQVCTIGGTHTSLENPFPTYMADKLVSHALTLSNVDTEWTTTREDARPETETITFPNGDSYKMTFTYATIGTRTYVKTRSRWIKV